MRTALAARLPGAGPAAGFPDVAAIIPAFNEGPRIGAVVTSIRATLPGATVLVINDGSRDDTRENARAAGARVLSHPMNLGYGAALQTGYLFALRHGCHFVVQLDADGQHDPKDALRLLEAIRTGAYDVAIGSRFISPSGYEMGKTRTFGRLALTRLLTLAGGPRIADPTSGYQALSRRAFAMCCREFFPADFPDVDVLLTLHRSGIRITEIPVDMAPSPPNRIPMHAGARVLYYAYKMSLALFRSSWGPVHELPGAPPPHEQREPDESEGH